MDLNNNQQKDYQNYQDDEEIRAMPLFEVENVILMGRSLGTGPASELASYACEILNRKPKALILVSAFESIK